jgi:biotin operon repressor
MSQEKFTQLLQFFKVLGNESRLKILGLLAQQERSVGELAAILGVREPTISHHLAMMKELGLAQVRADGNNRFYTLEMNFLAEMNKDIFSQDNLATLVDETAENAWEQKVLRAFVKDEQITAIPAREQKMLVVLRWLADKIEEGVQYPEAQLNELLQNYHEDYAAFRRYLVDYGFMQREKGVYWRVAE